jgi:pantoate--beta-alanine ligase
MSAPEVVAGIAAVRAVVARHRREGHTVGFVPTMGALHAGHAHLIETAAAECGRVVVSVFVNPTQFGPNEDFARYPRTLNADLRICEAAGAHTVFVPTVAEVYPEPFRTFVEVAGVSEGLCGASRPGHFRGVATVVLKLFNMVGPDVAYFGQKDAQQVRVIQTMVRDLDVPIQVRVVPTVREPDGLALSSRNRYLTPEERRHAVVLWQALSEAARRVAAGERDAVALRRRMEERVAATPGATLDYAAVTDAESLAPVDRLERPALAALAVFFGRTRLIDNVTLEPSPTGPEPTGVP